MIRIVIGSNFGDEGKGRIVADCSDKDTINILTNGGAQRGHTADNHVFHHFGSGTKRGAISYFFKDYLIDPIIFLKEKNELYKETGKFPICYRDPNCRWVTPYDVITNQLIEKSRDDKHGSCGMGIWETVKRYRDELFPDISTFNNYSFDIKVKVLKSIRMYCADTLKTYNIKIPYFFYSDNIIENYIHDLNLFGYYVEERDLKSLEGDWIFENAQGLLLNADPKNVHTTPSETGCKRIIDYLETIPFQRIEIIYVTRPYLTRHGAGPFEECTIEELGVKPDKTNVPNEFQGTLRYGKLNEYELYNRIEEDFKYCYNKTNIILKSLCITHLDEMSLNVDESKFYNVYRINTP